MEAHTLRGVRSMLDSFSNFVDNHRSGDSLQCGGDGDAFREVCSVLSSTGASTRLRPVIDVLVGYARLCACGNGSLEVLDENLKAAMVREWVSHGPLWAAESDASVTTCHLYCQ